MVNKTVSGKGLMEKTKALGKYNYTFTTLCITEGEKKGVYLLINNSTKKVISLAVEHIKKEFEIYSISINHIQTNNPYGERKIVKEKIEERLGNHYYSGIYMYFQDNRCLYVGQGQLPKRIIDHYNECLDLIKESDRNKIYKEFFKEHMGVIEVYYFGVNDRISELVLERILKYHYKPKFESWRVEKGYKNENRYFNE